MSLHLIFEMLQTSKAFRWQNSVLDVRQALWEGQSGTEHTVYKNRETLEPEEEANDYSARGKNKEREKEREKMRAGQDVSILITDNTDASISLGPSSSQQPMGLS